LLCVRDLTNTLRRAVFDSEEDVPSFNTTGHLLSVGRHPIQHVCCRPNEQSVCCHHKRVCCRSIDRFNTPPPQTLSALCCFVKLYSLRSSSVRCAVVLLVGWLSVPSVMRYCTVLYGLARWRASLPTASPAVCGIVCYRGSSYGCVWYRVLSVVWWSTVRWMNVEWTLNAFLVSTWLLVYQRDNGIARTHGCSCIGCGSGIARIIGSVVQRVVLWCFTLPLVARVSSVVTVLLGSLMGSCIGCGNGIARD